MPTMKTAEQRAAENRRYIARQHEAGIVKISVAVPSNRIPELTEIALAWRRIAKLLIESDQPSADQILQIHAVSRTLGVPLPVEAFESRVAAANWLLTHERMLEKSRALQARAGRNP